MPINIEQTIKSIKAIPAEYDNHYEVVVNIGPGDVWFLTAESGKKDVSPADLKALVAGYEQMRGAITRVLSNIGEDDLYTVVQILRSADDIDAAVQNFIKVNAETWKDQDPTEYMKEVRDYDEQ